MNTEHAAVAQLHHRVDGDPTAPALVLGPSLGTTLAMWDPQVERLAEHWRVIRFDTRGHGGSPVPDGPYSVEGLADDVLSMLDDIGVDSFGYCGLSLGGAIGQQLAADHPGRVRSLVLCCTAARFGEADPWHERAARVRDDGIGSLVEATRRRWFTEGFRARAHEQVERMMTMLVQTPPEGYAGCCEALADFDLRPRLAEVTAPTLVVAGEDDPATPPSACAKLSDGIIGAELLVVPEAAHLANVEQPDTLTTAITAHLERTCR